MAQDGAWEKEPGARERSSGKLRILFCAKGFFGLNPPQGQCSVGLVTENLSLP